MTQEEKPNTTLELDGWRPGLPPGEYYEGMEKDFEVYYSPGEQVWYRYAPGYPTRSRAKQGHADNAPATSFERRKRETKWQS